MTANALQIIHVGLTATLTNEYLIWEELIRFFEEKLD